jgi:ribosomal protein S12 methylthiotransferase accessory factor
MPGWLDDPYTGLVTVLVKVEPRAHDPAVSVSAGEMPSWFPGEPGLGCSGAGWSAQEADQACLGEALERCLARALPVDHSVHASWCRWPLDEPAVNPARWVLFHSRQYACPGFPFDPLDAETPCRWVCCREANSGAPVWVPEDLVFLMPRQGEPSRFTPGFSTGLSCAPSANLALLRGAQEVIERDALVGGWWGRYPVEEWPGEAVLALAGDSLWERLNRPNLTYRFYRIRTPYSSHVTMVSVSGVDTEGWVFCVSSACRETRRESWLKSLLEAVQGRHCVRRLLARAVRDGPPPVEVPTTFFEHALYYSLRRDRIRDTVLEHAGATALENVDPDPERIGVLRVRLGPEQPILFRNLTPPGLAPEVPGHVVLRVVIPGLQPLHGDHRLPFLGGPLWGQRLVKDWSTISPHPFA